MEARRRRSTDIDLYLRKIYGKSLSGTWTYTVSGSDDRVTWKEVGRATGSEWPDMREPGPSFLEAVAFAAPARFRSYRVQLAAANVRTWGVAELALSDKEQQVRVAGPDIFASAWMSAGSGEEWVYVDLGAVCTFDRIALAWIQRAAEGSIQMSDDATKWKTLQALPSGTGASDDIHLAQPARGRYVRVLMTKPANAGERYILSELEVYGRGGPVAAPASCHKSSGRWVAASCGRGTGVCSALRSCRRTARRFRQPGFADKDWMVATVPGTVLTSYLNDGAIPDPDFGDNQYAISDSFFYADFWYRDEFTVPAAQHPGEHIWLNFDGINWKADVYLNGERVGTHRRRVHARALRCDGACCITAERMRSPCAFIRVANPGRRKTRPEPP